MDLEAAGEQLLAPRTISFMHVDGRPALARDQFWLSSFCNIFFACVRENEGTYVGINNNC